MISRLLVVCHLLVALAIGNSATLIWAKHQRHFLLQREVVLAQLTQELVQSAAPLVEVNAYFVGNHTARSALESVFEQIARLPSVAAVHVAAVDGQIRWSSEGQRSGTRIARRGPLNRAMGGAPIYAEGDDGAQQSQGSERSHWSSGVYVPIRAGANVIGVLELERSATAISRVIVRRTPAVWLAVMLCTATLYGLLLWLTLAPRGTTRQTVRAESALGKRASGEDIGPGPKSPRPRFSPQDNSQNPCAARTPAGLTPRRIPTGLSKEAERGLIKDFGVFAAALSSERRAEAKQAVERALSTQRTATERMNEALQAANRPLLEPTTATTIPPDIRRALENPTAFDGVTPNGVNMQSQQRAMRGFLTRLLDDREHVVQTLCAARDARNAETWTGFSGSQKEALALGVGGRLERLSMIQRESVERLDAQIKALEDQLDSVGTMCRLMREFCTHELAFRLKDLFGLLAVVGARKIPLKDAASRWGPARFVWNLAERLKDVPLLWWRIRSPDRTWNPLTWMPRLPSALGVFGQLGGAIAIAPVAQLGLWGLVDQGEQCPETGQRTKTLESGLAFDMSVPFRASLGGMPRRWYRNRKQLDPTRREDVFTYGGGAPFFDVAQDAFIGTKAEVFVAGHFYVSIFRRPDGNSGLNLGILPKNLADIPRIGEALSALAEAYGIPGKWQRVLVDLPVLVPDGEGDWTAAQLVFKPWIGVCVRHPALGRPLHPPLVLLQGAFTLLVTSLRLGVSAAGVLWRETGGRLTGLGQHWELITPTVESTRLAWVRAFEPFKSEWYDWAIAGLSELWTAAPTVAPSQAQTTNHLNAARPILPLNLT